MTSRERFLTALRREQPDRVPMPLRMWKFLRKHDRGGGDALERACRAQAEFGIDIYLPISGYSYPCFTPLGTPWRDDVEVEMRHEARTDRNIWERTIHTPLGELHDIKQALIVREGSGDGPEIVEPLVKDCRRDLPLIRYMHQDPARTDVGASLDLDRRLGERGVGIAHIYSPIDCRDVMRPDDFLVLYYDDRDAFREVVRLGAEAMMAETRHALAGGLRLLQVWWFYASPSYGWSPTIYRDEFLPYLASHVELVHAHGGTYIYYDDGRMARFADMYVDTGIDCLMTCTPPPMGDAVPDDFQRRYGDRVCLMGGIDAVNEVYLSTPAKIRNMVRERLGVYKTDGGYIMDGSNSLVYETPAENVRALAEAGREFGAY